MHLIAGSLAAWFPEAQFVHCHRAFSRWATSWMAMILQATSRASLAGDTVPSWWKRYARLLVPGLDLQDLNEFENLPKMIQGLTREVLGPVHAAGPHFDSQRSPLGS